MLGLFGHKMAEGVGYFYSDHYTPDELVQRISDDMRLDVKSQPDTTPFRYGKEFKVTVIVEQMD